MRRSPVAPARRLAVFVLGAVLALVGSTAMGGLILGMLGVTDSRSGIVATSIVLVILLVLLTRWLLRREGLTLADLGLVVNRIRVREFGLGFLATLILFLGMALAQGALVGAEWDFQGGPGIRGAVLGLVVTLVLVLAEELVFRGVGLRYLRALYGDGWAILLSALLFGAYHLVGSGDWAMGAVFRFTMPLLGGLVFGWAAVKSNGLALPLGLHLGGNWVQSSLAGFDTAALSSVSPIEALWRIPLTPADVQALSAPDLLPRLPYIAALGLAFVATWILVRRGRVPGQTVSLGVLAGVSLWTAGCAIGLSGGGGGGIVRNAEDVPNHFEPKNPNARIMPADTIAGSGCLSPMVDPRDGTEIGFLRSAESYADYAVPGQLYGVGNRELLRLECNTGKVLGIVRR